uniref:DUF4371 domain-containing protein n=1 Tax=Latimeria chalumnae TaxID=7897 RepID=H2ZW03_LATCH
GFSNWKKAIERFGTHEKSNLHRAAVSSLGAVKAGVNVAAACSEAKQMKEARSALIKILSSVQYLSCQGLSVQGHTDKESNLNQLLALRAEDTPDLKSWLNRTKYRWISHDIVNEMIEIVAHDVLRTLMKEIHKAGFFSIIMDETADISVREQVSICFHIVNKNLDTEEIFFGFYNTSDTTSQALYTLLKDVLLRFDFPLKCRGQCYDGAASVAGCRRGLQVLVQEDEPQAVYVHCLAHTVNLVVQDVAQNIAACRNFLTLIRELISLVKNSLKCLAWFKEFQRAGKETLRSFCPTHWTLRAASLQSVASNYSELLEFLEELQKYYEVIDCVTNSLCNRFTSSVFTHMTEIKKFCFSKLFSVLFRLHLLWKVAVIISCSYGRKVKSSYYYLNNLRCSRYSVNF